VRITNRTRPSPTGCKTGPHAEDRLLVWFGQRRVSASPRLTLAGPNSGRAAPPGSATPTRAPTSRPGGWTNWLHQLVGPTGWTLGLGRV